MGMRNWMLTIVSAAALIGCAAQEPRDHHGGPPGGPGGPRGGPHMRAGQLDCPNSTAACDVFVGVYCPPTAGARCIVSVNFNVVEIHPNAGANRVTWRLQPGGDFAFAADGIGIDPNAFSCQGQGPFIFSCTARRGDSNQYKYVVKVVARQGGRVADPLDPWVVTN